MSSAVIQLIVLAGIAIFLILRLKNVLGTREGFEKPAIPVPAEVPGRARASRDFEVIEGGKDADILDHVAEGSAAALALAEMKRAEPSFHVGDFLRGARGAYEMILMAFERGDLDPVLPFLSRDVYDAFLTVVEQRERDGLTITSSFVGIRELALAGAEFNAATREGEIRVRFVGELNYVVKNATGEVVEGNANTIKSQRDVWTFARRMGVDDPNWQLVATDE